MLRRAFASIDRAERPMPGDAAHRVHDTGAGKVRVTVSETVTAAKGREPAAAPRPVGVEGIREGAHDERRDDER